MSRQRNLGMGGAGKSAREPAGKMLMADIRPNTEVEGQFVVRQKRLVPFKDPSKGSYLSLRLGDRSGELDARMWDKAEAFAKQFEEGDVVLIEGRAETYQDRTQLIVTGLSRIAPEQVDVADFLPQAERAPDEMMADIVAICKTVQQPHLRRLLGAFFADESFVAKFKVCPGAERVHHAYVGGLAEHTLHVGRLCEAVCQIHPRLDRDLLIAAALLHDIGKVQEYETGAAISSTDEGRLVGHTVIGYHLIINALIKIEGFPEELGLRLGHVVLSHHGKGEWGAPRDPALPEAFALHHAENLDAKVNRALDQVDKARQQGQRWTERDFFLDSALFVGEPEAED